MRFIVSDKPTRKDGRGTPDIGKDFVLVSESSRKKASSGSTKTGRIKQ